MQLKPAGDTLYFQRFFDDSDSLHATAFVKVYDGASTLQATTYATYATNGTFIFNKPSTGWGLGATLEKWTFTGTFGTQSFNSESYRLVGTDIIRTYITADELTNYYENVEDFFDTNEDTYVFDAYTTVNNRLEALGYQVPFSPKPDGYFDQPLRDLNAYEALFKIVSKRQSSFQRNGNEKPWFYEFKNMAESLYKNIEKKAYNFDREIGAGESGISIATKVAGTSASVMETNWRGAVGGGFSDSTFSRNWIVNIIGTGTAGAIDEATFTWSKDNGLNYATSTTSFDWQQLDYGVYVRFDKGTSTGTDGFYTMQDSWKFKTFPRAQSVGGKRTARSY